MPCDINGSEVNQGATVFYLGNPYFVLEAKEGFLYLDNVEFQGVDGTSIKHCAWIPSEYCELIQDLQISHEREIIKT